MALEKDDIENFCDDMEGEEGDECNLVSDHSLAMNTSETTVAIDSSKLSLTIISRTMMEASLALIPIPKSASDETNHSILTLQNSSRMLERFTLLSKNSPPSSSKTARTRKAPETTSD